MDRRAFLLLLAATMLASASAVAKQEDSGQDQPAPAETPQAPEPAGSGEALSLEDIKVNFTTVVQAYVAERSPDGYMPVESGGKLLKLSLDGIDAKSVHRTEEGLYAGRANLSDVETGSRVGAEFTADLSGTEWKVKGMRILSAASAKKKKPASKKKKPAKKKTKEPKPKQTEPDN